MDSKALHEERITNLLRRCTGRFDFYDLSNESTLSNRFDNPVPHWMRTYE